MALAKKARRWLRSTDRKFCCLSAYINPIFRLSKTRFLTEKFEIIALCTRTAPHVYLVYKIILRILSSNGQNSSEILYSIKVL